MRDAAREALAFVAGRSRADLETDRQLALALVKEIEIVGEAASRLSEELRASSQGVPWADIVGMRNRLVHVYFDIDLDRLWDTVQSDLPALAADVEQLLGEGAPPHPDTGQR